MLVVTSGGWKEPDGPGALKTPKPAEDRGVRRTGGWVGAPPCTHPRPGGCPSPLPAEPLAPAARARRSQPLRHRGAAAGAAAAGDRPGPAGPPRPAPGAELCRAAVSAPRPSSPGRLGVLGGGGAGPPPGVPAHPRLAAGGLGQFLGCSSCDGSSLERSSVICRRGESAGARPVTSRGKNTGGEVGAGLGTASRVPGDVRGFPPSGAVDWGCWVRPPRMVLRQVRQGRPRCFRLLVA